MNENLNTTPGQEQPNKKPQDIGAVALTIANFQNRHKDIVDSSLEKARKKGEKLPGKNDERRNYAYLSRLEKLINKHGNEAEKRLWQASINDDLLIKYENVTDTYWNAKKQELRDNGYGDINLTDEYKHELFNKERELQEESLQKWVNYLGDEHSPYPLWFKVYAWDGATKMGRYNKQKAKYEVRNETTVAPYPEPNAEVLGKVFETVNRYYGNGEKEFYTDEGERNVKLEKIIQSGSFPKIYNAIQQDISPILEPPEKTEDVHGQWVEYGLGDEDDIARAAKGTGWCIASSSTAKHYLEYGTYSGDNENYDEEYELKSKFILFHLEDSKTGKISRNACASIRLDPDGQVAEISGLKEGQALNDSLVPIVEAKVKTLPGGEKFLEAFADKNELIRLDRKMQNNEPLTKEELEFIYEIHRPIKTLDTYNENDPRIEELKEKYNIEYALDNGISVNQLLPNLYLEDIAYNLNTLIDHGADIDIDQLVSKLRPYYIINNLDTLINHGADINQLVSKLSSYDIVNNLDTLINHGADINQLVSKLHPYYIANNLDTLNSHGADIDISQLVSELRPYDIINNLDTLNSHGADIDISQLVSELRPDDIADNLDTLINHGAKINIKQLVLEQLRPSNIAKNLDTLISHGLDIDDLVSNLSLVGAPPDLLDTLISHGANINDIVSNMSSAGIINNLDTLISHGANIDDIVFGLSSSDTIKNLDTLISHGLDIDDLVSNLFPDDIANNLDTLRAHGYQG